MQLVSLLEKMKMEHLGAQLDAICEQAAKRDLGYREFLTEALQAEWRGRYQRGVESRLNMARCNRLGYPSFIYPFFEYITVS